MLHAPPSDPQSFETFYRRHFRSVVSFFYRRTANAQLAADLTSETFAEALHARRKFHGEASAAAWLMAIAHHELARALRKGRAEERARRRIGVPPIALDDESIERIEGLVDFEPLRRDLRRALESLPEGAARAVMLRIGEGLSYREVSVRLGCSEGAARVRVARGLSRLAELMEVS